MPHGRAYFSPFIDAMRFHWPQALLFNASRYGRQLLIFRKFLWRDVGDAGNVVGVMIASIYKHRPLPGIQPLSGTMRIGKNWFPHKDVCDHRLPGSGITVQPALFLDVAEITGKVPGPKSRKITSEITQRFLKL